MREELFSKKDYAFDEEFDIINYSIVMIPAGYRETVRGEITLPNDRKQIEFMMSMLSAVAGDRSREIMEVLPENQRFQVVEAVLQIMNMMPGGFFIYRADGAEELLYANKAMLRLFNCETLEELREHTGNSFRGIVHPDDLDAVEESIQVQIANSQYDLDYVEYRIIQKGGEVRWVEDYGHFIRNEVLGDVFCVFVGDATEKYQRRQEQLESISQERLRHLEVIEGLSIDYASIFYVDLDADNLQAYRVGTRIQNQFKDGRTSCPFEGFAEEYIKYWVVPEDRALLTEAMSADVIRKRLSDDRICHINYRIQNGDKVEYLRMQMVSVSGRGQVSQVVIGVRSVDDEIRKGMRQREALEDALKRANAAATAKEAFLANMSHDMRTPLNAIMGFANLGQKHMNDEEKLQGYLKQIETSGTQLLHLINDVLDLSRVEAGIGNVVEEPCDLLKLVEEIHASALSQAMEKRQQLTTDVSQLRHSAVYSDKKRLLNLALRLVGNAVKFTPPGGKILITMKELGDAPKGYGKYQFMVTDTGVGIEENFRKHIFEPFEREKSTTQSGLPGTGLGLTIAKSIVDMMGGTIEVESTPGKGSCFTVTMMFRLQNSGAEETQTAEMEHLLGKKVLVVEDNELNMEIALALLEDVGFATDTAENGQVALEKVKSSEPGEYALILMDIQMPVMDGYQAAQAIRALPDAALASIPIIAVSANTFEENMRKSMESGMNAHLPKPIDLEDLTRTIGAILDPA